MDRDGTGDLPTPVLGGGRFEIRGELGSGGAGVVYRAHDRELGREVALKWLRTASGRDLIRFKREFRALADIQHPNLVALHELHSNDGDWFFTMELVEGEAFIDWVRPSRVGYTGAKRTRADITSGAPNYARLRGSLIQLVDALVALHRAGKLHRDLKPSNVLVTALGRTALLDFGLVLQVSEGDPEHLAVGTPGYMSPEQAADQPLAEASDWYSVGCMLYEALVGRRPFEGEAADIMMRKQRETPTYPTEIAPNTPPDLARLCASLLKAGPKDRPSGEQILTQLGAAPSKTTRKLARSVPPVVFVGRTSEVDEMRRALADARRRGMTLIVRGRSGIGKSTLVRRFVRDLGEAVTALEGRCFEREAVPFKMLDGVVDALSSALVSLSPEQLQALVLEGRGKETIGSLARLFPVMRRVPLIADASTDHTVPADPAELRQRGFAALRGVIVRMARTKPVVIVVDDAHWGDADSCTFLAELIHGGDPGVLVVLVTRPEDYRGVMAQLRRPPSGSMRRGDIRDLEVVPLATDDALALVAQLAPPGSAEAIVAAAEGNPLALVEMSRAGEFPAGTKMDDLVRVRMLRLSPDAQALLAVSSVAARPLPVAIAAYAADTTGGLDEAAALVADRLATLRHADGVAMLHPAHDYVRSAVLAALGPESRASIHEAIARAFEVVQGPDKLDSLAVVEHWLAAGHPQNAAHHAVTAALHAEGALAFKRAAELYQIALTFGSWDIEGQRDLIARKAASLAAAGQLSDAATEYGLAAQLLPGPEAIDLERLRVETLLRCGRLPEALPAAEQLLARVGLRVPLTTRSRTKLATQWVQMKLRGLDFTERAAVDVPPDLLRAVDILYSVASGLAFADPALGRVVQTELLRCALDAGEPGRVGLALAQELIYGAAAGGRNRNAITAVAVRLDALASRLGDPRVSGLADTAIGIAAHAAGQWTEARARLETGLATLRDHGAGVRWEIDIGDTYWLATLFYLGEWRELSRQHSMLMRDALERDDASAQLWLRSGRCNLAWLVAGRTEDARTALVAVEKSLAPDDFHLTHLHALMAAANVDLARGEIAAANARLRSAHEKFERLGVDRMQQPRIELAVLRARLALADTPRRAREARDLSRALASEDVAWARALGQLFGAACAAWDGDVAAATIQLQGAEAELDAAAMVGYVQIARLYRAQIEGGPAGMARAAAARDALSDLGAASPETLARELVPWPGDGGPTF
ncbi:MAG TPA: protein kinase [Kofleriaceae bacterium]|jgi:hypothetical protein